MSHGFLPRTDSELFSWANRFSLIMLSEREQYGISQQQSDEFAAATEAYRSALAAAQNPATRTRGRVCRKDDMRAVLKRQAGVLNKIIQANPNVTNLMKASAGLTITRERTRIGRPETAPVVYLGSVSQHIVNLRILQDGARGNGRPRGTVGALVMGLVSDVPEPDISKYQLMGIASRSRFQISFPATLPPGTKVWLCAMWLNNRKETGPVSCPTYTFLQGGGLQANQSMRLAA